MDTATLRRLMADRDGGMLSDDVIALLDAHVMLCPATRAEMEEYGSITQKVRAAMNPSAPIGLPAFPREAVSAAVTSKNGRPGMVFSHRGRMVGLAAAACVVFAFFAGRLSHMTDLPRSELPVRIVMDEQAPRSSAGIWSIDERRRAQRLEVESSSSSIKWNSPLELSPRRS